MKTTNDLPLILASSSPRRQELLRLLQPEFTVHPSEEEETVPPGTAPQTVVEQLSLLKAQSVAKHYAVGVVIGSDTIVVKDGEILGKPRDEKDAYRMLEQLHGESHAVYTGVAVINKTPDGRSETAVSHTVSKVTFRTMSPKEIMAYIRSGEPMDKAGAYGIQGLGACFVEKIEGDFYSIMGLPVNLLYKMLLKFGISPF